MWKCFGTKITFDLFWNIILQAPCWRPCVYVKPGRVRWPNKIGKTLVYLNWRIPRKPQSKCLAPRPTLVTAIICFTHWKKTWGQKEDDTPRKRSADEFTYLFVGYLPTLTHHAWRKQGKPRKTRR